MGTNYFVQKNKPTVHEPIHIGKSSIGWLFHFHREEDTWNDPPIVWNNYEQVKAWLKANTVDSSNYVILNEYDEIVSYNDLIELIEAKQHDEFCQSNPDNFGDGVDNVDGYRFSSEWFR